MGSRYSCALAASLIGCSVWAGAAQQPPLAGFSEIKAAEDRYFRLEPSQRQAEFGAELEKIHRRDLRHLNSQSALENLDSNSVRQLFDALQLVVFFTNRLNIAEQMSRVLQEIDRRGLAGDDDRWGMYQAWLVTHQYRKAQEVAAKSESIGIPRVPPIVDRTVFGTDSRVLDISDDYKAITIRKLRWKKGPRIILLASPSCAPTQRAVADIDRDPRLANLFSEYGLLITPPQAASEMLEISGWNKLHPSWRQFIAYSARDWPIFERMSTPTFLFINDGKVVERIRGWMGDSNTRREELLMAARRIGLVGAHSGARSSR